MNKATESLFKPNRQESKAQTTDTAARAILETEAAKREAKTARLRAARLAMEAGAAAEKPAPRKKATAKAAR
jgi:hypothetical protein